MFQSDKYKIKWDEGDELKHFDEKPPPQRNNPLYLAKNSLLKNKANYEARNNESVYQNELRKSEEQTEEYSDAEKIHGVNSNYISNVSIYGNSSKMINQIEYEPSDPNSPYLCQKHPDRQVEYFCCECYSLVCPK
jgi:hypothetical protein